MVNPISLSLRYSNFNSFLQGLLLSKALKLQQDDEDRKNKIVVKGFEDKIKKLEDSLKEKKMICCIQPKDRLPKRMLRIRN
jgi:hypothetical protein